MYRLLLLKFLVTAVKTSTYECFLKTLNIMNGKKRQSSLLNYFPEKAVKVNKESEEDPSDVISIKCPEWTDVNRNNLNISYAVVLDKLSCQKLFDSLEREIEYFQGELAQVKVFGKCHPIPRQQSAYGDEGLTYKYSGTTVPAYTWTDSLANLRDMLERLTGVRWDTCLDRCRDNFLL